MCDHKIFPFQMHFLSKNLLKYSFSVLVSHIWNLFVRKYIEFTLLGNNLRFYKKKT